MSGAVGGVIKLSISGEQGRVEFNCGSEIETIIDPVVHVERQRQSLGGQRGARLQAIEKKRERREQALRNLPVESTIHAFSPDRVPSFDQQPIGRDKARLSTYPRKRFLPAVFIDDELHRDARIDDEQRYSARQSGGERLACFAN